MVLCNHQFPTPDVTCPFCKQEQDKDARIVELERELAAAKAEATDNRQDAERIRNADVLAKHSGETDRREWHSVGAWLYPGQQIVKVDAIDAARKP